MTTAPMPTPADEIPPSAPPTPPTTTTTPLACPSCGVATAEPDDSAELVTARPYTSTPVGRERDLAPVPMARCADCRQLRDLATALLDRHPGMLARIGNVAAERCEAALCALACLGRPLPDPETVTAADLASLLRHLAGVGMAVRWQRHVGSGGRPPISAGAPFAHVAADERARLRAGYAATLAERIARDAPPPTVPPPDPASPAGCLFCGTPEAVRWHHVTTSPTALGGRPSPSLLVGYLCPPCSAARDTAGSVGPSALTRALAAHLARAGEDRAASRLAEADRHAAPARRLGLVGWGVLAHGRPANAEPWQHLDLSDLSEVPR